MDQKKERHEKEKEENEEGMDLSEHKNVVILGKQKPEIYADELKKKHISYNVFGQELDKIEEQDE